VSITTNGSHVPTLSERALERPPNRALIIRGDPLTLTQELLLQSGCIRFKYKHNCYQRVKLARCCIIFAFFIFRQLLIHLTLKVEAYKTLEECRSLTFAASRRGSELGGGAGPAADAEHDVVRALEARGECLPASERQG